MRPRAGPVQPSIATTTSPVLRVVPLTSPDRVAVVALADGDLVEHVVDGLLERAALGGAAVGLLRDGLGLLLVRALPLELEPQALDRLVHLLQAGVVLVGALLDDGQRGALVDRQRVVVRVGGELLAQVVADLHGGLGQHRLHAVLDRDRRLVAEMAGERAAHVPVVGREGLVELLVEPLGDLARALDELGVELARGLLELRLDELDVRAGLLAVQHAGADLDRVADDPRGIVTGLLARPHELDGRRVVDREPVDEHAVGEHGDARVAERSGSFHTENVAGYAPDLTEPLRMRAKRLARRSGARPRSAGDRRRGARPGGLPPCCRTRCSRSSRPRSAGSTAGRWRGSRRRCRPCAGASGSPARTVEALRRSFCAAAGAAL